MRDGYVNIWYAIGSGSDVKIMADTVSVSGNPQRPWRTSLTEDQLARNGQSRTTATGRQKEPDEILSESSAAQVIAAETASDQPAEVIIDAPLQVSGWRRQSQPTPPTLCSVSNTFPNSLGRVTVGTIYLDQNWTSTFSYVNQTVHQTQWNLSGSLDVPIRNVTVSMGVGGTLAVTERVLAGSPTPINVSGSTGANQLTRRIQPMFEWRNQEWKCISTIPTVPARYQLVSWPWRVRYDLGVALPQSSTIPACANNSRLVAARRDFNRTTGTSTTDFGPEYSFGLGIPGVSASVSAQSTTTYVQQSTQFWVNNFDAARWICATNGSLTGTATIVATSRK